MDIFMIAAFGICGALLCVTLKSIRPEFATLTSLCIGAVIIFYVSEELSGIMEELFEIVRKYNINGDYFSVALKACAIAYITQFAKELCADAGENAIGLKLELCGKISIILISMPVVSEFLETVGNLLDKV